MGPPTRHSQPPTQLVQFAARTYSFISPQTAAVYSSMNLAHLGPSILVQIGVTYLQNPGDLGPISRPVQFSTILYWRRRLLRSQNKDSHSYRRIHGVHWWRKRAKYLSPRAITSGFQLISVNASQVDTFIYHMIGPSTDRHSGVGTQKASVQ